MLLGMIALFICLNMYWCAAPLCQVESGAQVIQVFDSWAGHLSPKDYDLFAAPYQVSKLIDQLLYVLICHVTHYQ